MKSITKLSLLVFMLCSFSVTYAQPSTPAPTPTHNAADVAVIFSDFYTTTLKLEPQNWGKPASIESIATNANDKVLKCTNTNDACFTSHWAAQTKGYVHFDVYSESGGVFELKMGVGFNSTVTTIANYSWPTLQAGVWTSVDVPVLEFVKSGLNDAVNVQTIQFKGTGVNYVDNIYAWGDKVVYVVTADIPVAPTPMRDASMVKSVFSDSYTPSQKGIAPQTFGGTIAKKMPYKSDANQNVLSVEKLGTSLSTIDTWNIKDMDYIHLDVYWNYNSTEAYTGAFSFGMNASDWSGNNIKTLTDYTWPVTIANAWVGFDIPIANYSTAGLNLQQITQMKFFGSGNFYVDNLYAYYESPSSVPTLENANVRISIVDNVINSTFDGAATVKLFSISGQLIDYAPNTNGLYKKQVQKGMYILSINDKAYKLAVK